MSVKVFVLTLRQLKIGLNEREREITTDTTYYSRKKKMKKDRLDLGTPLVKQNKKDPLGLSLRIC